MTSNDLKEHVVKERPLVLIYRNWNACQKFRREHQLGLRPREARISFLKEELLGCMAFDFILVDTDLTPEWEEELNRRQCRHVIPTIRLRYRILDSIERLYLRIRNRLVDSVFPERVRRVPVVK
jgi:hypothetical protein